MCVRTRTHTNEIIDIYLYIIIYILYTKQIKETNEQRKGKERKEKEGTRKQKKKLQTQRQRTKTAQSYKIRAQQARALILCVYFCSKQTNKPPRNKRHGIGRVLCNLANMPTPSGKGAQSALKAAKNAAPAYYSYIIDNKQSNINATRPYCACICCCIGLI